MASAGVIDWSVLIEQCLEWRMNVSVSLYRPYLCLDAECLTRGEEFGSAPKTDR